MERIYMDGLLLGLFIARAAAESTSFSHLVASICFFGAH
jgi:hypothetical protein